MATEGKKYKRKQFLFNGEWIPTGDALTIGENNYDVLQNLRYRKNGLEAINGYSKINTTALGTYLKPRTGIQFINPLNNVSHTLIHAQNSDDTARAVVENKTAIPDQGDFEAGVVHTDVAGAGRGRFSLWPNGTVAYCNGMESKVYSGAEMQCAALINYAPSGDFKYDYSDIIGNIENDTDNIAVLHRVDESLGDSSVLLLHLDNNVTDSSPVTPHTVTNTNVTFSDTVKKFGTYAGYFNGTDAKLTIPDNTDFDFSAGHWAIDLWFRVSDWAANNRGLYYQALDIYRVGFFGGTFMPIIGETLLGDPSGATSTLLDIEVTSGSWAGHDAGGYFYVKNPVGNYQVGEDLVSHALQCGKATTSNILHGQNSFVIEALSDQNIQFKITTNYYTEITLVSLLSPAAELSADTWYHLEVGENDDNWYMFINGNIRDYLSSSNRASDYPSEITIGEHANFFKGSIDEIRVSSDTVHTAAFSVPMIAYGSTAYNTYIYLGSTRQIQAVKATIETANTAVGALGVQYWDGEEWQAVTNLVDGTALGGVPLAQTGIISFDDTVSTAIVKIIDSRCLYWYRMVIANADDLVSISHITVDAPFQSIKDLWDGIYRLGHDFQIYKDDQYNDYTLNIAGADYSSTNEATYAQAGALTTDDYLLIGFEDRIMGLKVKLTGDSVNTNNAFLTIYYWNGVTWTSVGTIEDGTLNVSVSFAGSGEISWNPPDMSDEFKYELNKGAALHYYKISFSAALSADVKIDRIYGITAPRNTSRRYTFPFMFQERAMLCGHEGEQQGNRVDYGIPGATEVWNGTDASAGAGAIYFGGNDSLTCACRLYNRFGASLYNLAVFCKRSETYLLYGYDPATWKVYQISEKIGCPAPLTMDSAEIGYGVTEDIPRNVAVWLSYAGPVVFDGATILPVKDTVSCYFDKNDSRCINYDAMESARGWVDPEHNEYNLLIPSGTGQTECNVWLVLDLLRMHWYEKAPAGTNSYPQMGIRVMDGTGNQYVYGCIDTGTMLRLEHGPTWDGEAIDGVIRTTDQIPTGDIWDYTKIDRLKLVAETMAEDVSVAVTHNADGMVGSTELMSMDLAGVNRHTRQVKTLNLQAWSHQFGFSFSQSITTRRLRLLLWGYQYEIIREDVTVDTDGLNKLAEKMILAGR